MRYALPCTFLLALLLMTLPAAAQVGVNNLDPEQALDVAGKVRISDDATPPSEGTIRYNAPESTFEGFADGEWQTLNGKSAQADTPIPVILAMFPTPPSPTAEDMDFVDIYGNAPVNFDFNADNERRVVPPGYFLVIDMIEVLSTSSDPDDDFLVNVAVATSSNPVPAYNPQIFLSGSKAAGNSILTGGRGPLLVLPAGRQLIVRNDSDSDSASVRVIATGFLVTDLDQYFSY